MTVKRKRDTGSNPVIVKVAQQDRASLRGRRK